MPDNPDTVEVEDFIVEGAGVTFTGNTLSQVTVSGGDGGGGGGSDIDALRFVLLTDFFDANGNTYPDDGEFSLAFGLGSEQVGVDDGTSLAVLDGGVLVSGIYFGMPDNPDTVEVEDFIVEGAGVTFTGNTLSQVTISTGGGSSVPDIGFTDVVRNASGAVGLPEINTETGETYEGLRVGQGVAFGIPQSP